MTQFVVDASVSVKWFLPEEHRDAAIRLIAGGHDLLAPELLLPEFGNVIWKKYRRGELDGDEVRGVFRDFRRLPLRFIGMAPYLENALTFAIELEHTVYDCIYLALAIHHDVSFVTADRKFYDALKDSPVGKTLVWVEDLK